MSFTHNIPCQDCWLVVAVMNMTLANMTTERFYENLLELNNNMTAWLSWIQVLYSM